MSDAAIALWERHRPRRAVRLVGVTAAGIEARVNEQLALLPDEVRLPPGRAQTRPLDAVVARFGRDSVVRGGSHAEKGLTTRLKRGE